MRVFTIGHSNTPVETLFERLRQHNIKIVVDVRSKPFSRYNPHFNRPEIKEALEKAGFHYVWMGDVLGGVPDGPGFRTDGKVDYDKIRASSKYQEGLDELLRGLEVNAQVGTATLMCSEADPTKCHRRRLVGADLIKRGVELSHVLKDGSVEDRRRFEKAWEKGAQRFSIFCEFLLDGDRDWL